ncbi:MAG: inner membrane protein [uncultured Nocardioidaceae bacterium]|uniref:Inner membrane protein n=1 Tax=uncultured Nocardioidaceae bacterium TaxID=253824 RepID=A0A6J4LRL7_9ACTN|nr:MAG: inner membrane protein [uncultured Nocardioidaceae bacterium]
MSNLVLSRAFVAVAIAEAVSWAGLLAGMYVKYLTDAGDLGVRVFGPLHGGVFVLYVLLTLLLAARYRWSLGTTLVGLGCSVPPFATVAFELWVVRSGRLPLRSSYVRADARAVPAGESAGVGSR